MKIAIVGCAGVPATYGGFETLAENLVLHCERRDLGEKITVYCSARHVQNAQELLPQTFHGAHLTYVPLSANGVSSIVYDAWSMLLSVSRRADVILVLGVSGAIAMPLVRCLRWWHNAKIVTNIDGIEWKRAKWRGLARHFLRFSEWLAVRCSDVVVADNQGVADHVLRCYGVSSSVIAYGGDHAVDVEARPLAVPLPDRYALALCRIEPENNVEMILEAFSRSSAMPLVFVGNWNAGEFGRRMRARFRSFGHLYLLDPEYDPGVLKTLRSGASLYVHGHSAGGTNPSLVEMMHFGVTTLCYDCTFNRYTTEGKALFFRDVAGLVLAVARVCWVGDSVGSSLQTIARNRYTWEEVGFSYFQLLRSCLRSGKA